MSGFDVQEECPHCEEPQPSRQMDVHVATAHADLPPCTARIENEHRETYRCAYRAGHDKGEYGQWHASRCDGYTGSRYVWNDSALGATPHRPSEPSDSLDELKAAGIVSHAVAAISEGRPKPLTVVQAAVQQLDLPQPYRWDGAGPHRRHIKVTCAVLHTDAAGNVIPCPDDEQADPQEVGAERDEGRPEAPTEAELNQALPVRPDPRQGAYDAVYEYIRALGDHLPPDSAHRNAVIWRAVHAALDATPVGRCVSSHCVEDDHILDLGEAP